MIDFLSHVRADADRIAAVAEMGLDAPVPSAPGWTVSDLLAHTGVVYAHKATIVGEGWVDEQPAPVDAPTEGVLGWFREQADHMLKVLTAADPTTPIATWSPVDKTVGFWCRRMAHESVIHRLDAELAHSVVTPVDAGLGADGIDEILVLMMTGAPDWAESSRSDQIISIAEAKGGRTWRLRVGDFTGTSPRGNTYAGEPTFFLDDSDDDVSASVAGPPGDVDAWLWGRGGLATSTVVGDAELVDLVRRVASDSTG
ncbi:MAG: maleylpyruvate isomerase family mycothiol-dependent enzyme [bacterium]|nr:maleylpyruvate isomerase family mycothiol-dependent enzyme [bacterium]